MKQAIRDTVVDFVRYWSCRTEILLGRLLTWLGIPSSNYYDWRKRYGEGKQA